MTGLSPPRAGFRPSVTNQRRIRVGIRESNQISRSDAQCPPRADIRSSSNLHFQGRLLIAYSLKRQRPCNGSLEWQNYGDSRSGIELAAQLYLTTVLFYHFLDQRQPQSGALVLSAQGRSYLLERSHDTLKIVWSDAQTCIGNNHNHST